MAAKSTHNSFVSGQWKIIKSNSGPPHCNYEIHRPTTKSTFSLSASLLVNAVDIAHAPQDNCHFLSSLAPLVTAASYPGTYRPLITMKRNSVHTYNRAPGWHTDNNVFCSAYFLIYANVPIMVYFFTDNQGTQSNDSVQMINIRHRASAAQRSSWICIQSVPSDAAHVSDVKPPFCPAFNVVFTRLSDDWSDVILLDPLKSVSLVGCSSCEQMDSSLTSYSICHWWRCPWRRYPCSGNCRE